MFVIIVERWLTQAYCYVLRRVAKEGKLKQVLSKERDVMVDNNEARIQRCQEVWTPSINGDGKMRSHKQSRWEDRVAQGEWTRSGEGKKLSVVPLAFIASVQREIMYVENLL